MVNNMSSTEEYLDQLLAAAIQANNELLGIANKKEEPSSEKEEALKERTDRKSVV